MKRTSAMNGILMAFALFGLIVVALLLSSMARAAESEPIQTYTLTIETDGDQGTFRIDVSDRVDEHTFYMDRVKRTVDGLHITDDLDITPDGIVSNGQVYDISNLRVEQTYQKDNVISVIMKNRMQSEIARNRRTPKNWVVVSQDLVIGEDDFVRGEAIAFGGAVDVSGEINRNAVAFFGDVDIESSGIVRGGVVAFGGRINVKGEGAVYGALVSSHGVKKSGRSRIRSEEDEWTFDFFDPEVYYNRVDGLHLGGTMTFSDPDSVLPKLYAGGGYSFSASKWRYKIGVHQRFFDQYSFSFGGSFFKQTSTDDEWLSSRRETSILAMLAAEDFEDYYDEEGGRLYATFNPGYYNELGASYSYTRLSWMDHHPKLWSVFGWDKEFRANFSSVPAAERMAARPEFDSKMGLLTAWYTLDTRDNYEDTYSGWWGRIEYQTAGAGLKGDINFDRLTLEVRRFQPVVYRQRLNLRLKYGTSGRDLPLFREFYLGGMRTVRGMDHKSLRGEQMILANVEYVLDFPWHSFETALLFDAGNVVSRNESVISDGDFRTSIGLRAGFDEGLRLEVAKSLDDMDKSAKLWVVFQKSF